MFYITIVLMITGLALWLHRARAAPSTLYGHVFVFIAMGLYALTLLNSLDPYLTWRLPGTSRDVTTVFVAQTRTPFWVKVAVATTLALPVLLWVQERSGAMYYPDLTRWLIWPLLAGLMIVNALFLAIVQLTTITSAGDAVLSTLQRQTLLIGMMSIPALYILALLSFLRRARETPR